MTKPTQLTNEEREQRADALREWHKKRNSDPKFLGIRDWLLTLFKSTDHVLCGFAARQMITLGELSRVNKELVDQLNLKQNHAGMLSSVSNSDDLKRVLASSIIKDYPRDEAASVYSQVVAMQLSSSKRGQAAADALHSRPGGSRAKRQAMLDIWSSGKYTSRDRCAEEEFAAVGLSYSKARKHLIGTKDNPKISPK